MSRHYSVREFFRQMPNVLLRRYFLARRLFGDLDFDAMTETRPDSLLKAWNDLPDRERKPMETEFREIFDLSSEKGFIAIRDEAKWRLGRDPGRLPR
jgi:hypothetical protein